jgi:TPR repeat protein
MKWFRQAADAGNSGAMNNIGWLYHYGRGVPQDYAEAMRWYR